MSFPDENTPLSAESVEKSKASINDVEPADSIKLKSSPEQSPSTQISIATPAAASNETSFSYKAASFESYINSNKSASGTAHSSQADGNRTSDSGQSKLIRIVLITVGVFAILLGGWAIVIPFLVNHFVYVIVVLYACIHLSTIFTAKRGGNQPSGGARQLYRQQSNPATIAIRLVIIGVSLIAFIGALAYGKIAGEASVAYDRGDYQTAADKYGLLLTAVPLGPLHLQRAQCYRELGEHQKAIDDYTAAMSPPTIGLYYARAKEYEALGKNELSKQDTEKGNALAKGGGLEATAQDLYDSGQYQDALQVYNILLKEQPKSARLYVDRANTFYQLKIYGYAVNDCAHAIKLKPSFGEAYYLRGQAYEELGKTAKADLDFEKATELKYVPPKE